MATKKNVKKAEVIDIAKDVATEDLAIAEEKEVVENADVQPIADVVPVVDQKESDKASEVVNNSCKENKVKIFIKKHWKKAAIGAGILGAGVLGFFIGKKVTELDDDEIAAIGQQAIDDNWRKINQLLVDDPDQSYATKITNKENGHVDWLEVNHIDTEPEWIQNGEGTAAIL